MTTPPLACLGLVPSSLVDPATRQVVDRALALARRRLGLPWVDVRWFCGRYHALGFIDRRQPQVVWLHTSLADYPSEQVAEITAHECQHVSDALAGRPQDEARALAFGEILARAYHVPE